MIEADSTRARERGYYTPLIRLMEWIKQSIPIKAPDLADARQL